MINQMKSGSQANFKRPNNQSGIANSPSGPIQIAPKRANDLVAGNDDEFWYGDKKDKRFGSRETHTDLPPVPENVKNEVLRSSDSFKNANASRKLVNPSFYEQPRSKPVADNTKTVRPAKKQNYPA